MDTLVTNQTQSCPLIVIADDEPISLKLMCSVAEKIGRLIATSSGAELLAAVLANKPDLILLDWNLGDMNGVEICRQLKVRPEFADTPILIITSQNDADSEIAAMDAGAADFITKPFHQRVLLSRAQAHLRQGLHARHLVFEADQAKERKELLRAVTEHLPVGIAYWDKNEICQFCNQAYANLLSKPIQGIVGSRYCDMLGPVVYGKLEPLIRQALEGIPQTFNALLANEGVIYLRLCHC